MCVLTNQLRLELRGIRYKVALYLSYLHLKFDDKTKGNLFEFQAYFTIRLSKVKLKSRFGFICSQILEVLRLVTQIYGNEHMYDK